MNPRSAGWRDARGAATLLAVIASAEATAILLAADATQRPDGTPFGGVCDGQASCCGAKPGKQTRTMDRGGLRVRWRADRRG